MTFRWRTCGIALVCLTLGMVAIWLSSHPPYYMTNDDVTIRMALEGRSAPNQPPTGFALMTHAVLGWALVGLHLLLPSVPWWDVTLAATLLVGLAVLVALVWDALGASWVGKATAVVALLAGMAPFLATIQFTISGTLAGGAAVLLAITELGAERRRWTVLAMATLLFVIGLLVRPMAAVAGGGAAALMLVPNARFRLWPLAHAVGVVAIIGAIFAAAQYVDVKLYTVSQPWDEYLRYNWIVGPLLEWAGDLSNQHGDAIRQSVGWTSNDWLMLVGSLGVDPAIHGFRQVSHAYETRAALVGWSGVLPWITERLMASSLESFIYQMQTSTVVILVIAVLTFVYARWRGIAGAAAVVVLYCGLCLMIERLFDRLPTRLLGPIEVILIAAILMTIGRARRKVSPVISVIALGVIATLLIPLLTASAADAQLQRRTSESLLAKDIAGLHDLSPSLVILYGSAFPREYWWRPFHQPPRPLPAIALGWNNQNPDVQRFLDQTGRQPLFRALCSDPSVLIVATQQTLDLIGSYMREHYATSVRWELVYEAAFPVWRCEPVMKKHSASS